MPLTLGILPKKGSHSAPRYNIKHRKKGGLSAPHCPKKQGEGRALRLVPVINQGEKEGSLRLVTRVIWERRRALCASLPGYTSGVYKGCIPRGVPKGVPKVVYTRRCIPGVYLRWCIPGCVYPGWYIGCVYPGVYASLLYHGGYCTSLYASLLYHPGYTLYLQHAVLSYTTGTCSAAGVPC